MAGTEANPQRVENESPTTCEVLLLRPLAPESGKPPAVPGELSDEDYSLRRISLKGGLTLLEAARIAGFPIGTECGGFGKCTRCRAIPLALGDKDRPGPHPPSWLTPPNAAERNQLSPEELGAGWRLACQLKVEGDLAALAPHPSDKVGRKSIDTSIPLLLEPWAERVAFCSDLAVEEDAALAIRRGLRKMSLSGRLKELPRLEGEIVLRLNEAILWNQEASVVSLTITEGEVVDVEAGDTSKRVYGAVIDIGTTNICGYLVHLINGSLLAEAVRPNSQRTWGWDLMARVHAASQREHGGKEALDELTSAVREDVDRILGDLLRQARVRRRDMISLIFVGNSVMHHFFFGLPVESFGVAPYVPLKDEGMGFSPADLGVRLPSSARAHFLPLIAGFVGADALGVALALDLGREELKKPLLALDLGTNVEILLACQDGNLWCTSTPAGPAFEGGEIRCGMSSVPGAISEIDVIEDHLEFRTIESSPPAGICGTGLIEVVACLLDLGVIDNSGRILPAEESLEGVPESVRRRIVEKDGVRRFILEEAGRSASGSHIFLDQWDVRKLQSAKAAVMAGANILLREAGIEWGELETVFLAGAFGAHLRSGRAARIGLIPPLPEDRVRIVHNAAASGGRLALLSREKLAQAAELKVMTRNVELAGHPEFQDAFVQAIPFPGA